MKTRKTPFAQLLDEAMVEWQHMTKRSAFQRDFAEWLGIKNTTYSTWVNGSSVPIDTDSIKRVAQALARVAPAYHDRVYLALGIPVPDVGLEEIITIYPGLNEKQREDLLQAARNLAGKGTTASTETGGHNTHASPGRDKETVEHDGRRSPR